MNDFENIKNLLDKYNKVFIVGAGGVGKSFNINKIVEHYKQKGLLVEKCGTTGISAFNIKGRTINSLLKFADTNSIEEYQVWLELQESNVTNFKFDKGQLYNKLRNIISNLDLLIIDEVSMISGQKWELIDYLLDLFDFQGKILISGDVFQLPPISTKSKYIKEEITDSRFFFESENWKRHKFVPYVMEKVYRTDNLEFIEVLKNVRMGNLEQKDINYLKEMMNNTYVEDHNPTILASTNDYVFNYNKNKLQEIREDLCIIEQEIEMKQDKDRLFGDIDKDIDDYISKQLMIEKKLYLKKGALVIFIANGMNYYNGEKGIVLDIEKQFIEIRKDNGDVIKLDKQSFGYYDYVAGKFTLIANIKQFPIKLGFAITIHKCQGLSIDNIILNIDKIFAKGQFYVGISRAINPKNVLIQYKKGKYMFDVDLRKYTKVDDRLKQFYEKAKRIHNFYKK